MDAALRPAGPPRQNEGKPMKLLYINPWVDPGVDRPGSLLDRYRSTTLWCRAVQRQGIEVTVWQAFPAEAELKRDGVHYRFRPFPRRPHRCWPGDIRALAPDVVHLDGLIAPLRLFRLIKAGQAAGVPVVVQDHGGRRRGPGPAWRVAAAALGPRPAALLFSAAALAEPWLTAGIFPRETPVLEVMESSSGFVPDDRRQARRALGLDGDPLVVTVGRLNRGKDPLTLMNGFAAFAGDRPGARLALAFQDAPLLPRLERLAAADPRLGDRVSFLGRLDRRDVQRLLSAADVFASASRHEGSGYAALEALACGAWPVLSGIPSFEAMTGKGRIGCHFPAGDAAALERALANTCAVAEAEGWERMREDILGWFTDELGPEALGRNAAAAYAAVAGTGPV